MVRKKFSSATECVTPAISAPSSARQTHSALTGSSCPPTAPMCTTPKQCALFRLKMDITDSIPAYIAHLRKNGYDVHAAALTDDAVPLDTVPVTKQTVFVIGNEGHGLSEETVSACGGAVIIPMAEGAESLNAAICAALLMWERAKI